MSPPPAPFNWRQAFDRRTSGVLLHFTALPGPHGCGDLGPEAHQFVEFLARAGQSWWQTLPIHPPGRAPAFSPYDGASAFAGSPWLISLDELAARGLLTRHDLVPSPGLTSRRVNFPPTLRHREERLHRAFVHFRRRGGERSRRFLAFCETQADWLEDYALFAALRRASEGKPWTDWEDALRRRRSSALQAARQQLTDEIAAHRFAQFEFDRQWQALRHDAHRHGIGLIGDLPIFVAHDSADVWAHQDLFQLDARGQPRRVSGYPPDRFNRDGQHWGHPQYRWEAHAQSGFAWWLRRFTRLFTLFDVIRIDHFLGFTRTWSIPGGGARPADGHWVPAPGRQLFTLVRRQLGDLPLIAEDLGHVTPADVRLREDFGLAPMRLFQFGFGEEPDSAEHLPHNYRSLCAAYPGNHDNNTAVGWFRELPATLRRRVLAYTGGHPSTIHHDMVRALLCSPAGLIISPLQDLLGLGCRARMNIPGTITGNWAWRLDQLPGSSIARLLRSQIEPGPTSGFEHRQAPTIPDRTLRPQPAPSRSPPSHSSSLTTDHGPRTSDL